MDCRLLYAVSKCIKLDEACAKRSARALYDCPEEVPIGLFRADLKCG
ncbi:MAG: hypothetical protein JZD41_06155 [Thermoproteus sp.]|nr:hypothetical protein [Thermoproteus sp.]